MLDGMLLSKEGIKPHHSKAGGTTSKIWNQGSRSIVPFKLLDDSLEK